MKKIVWGLGLWWVMGLSLWAQSGGILKGVLTDAETLEPLEGATVFLLGAQKGAYSDETGTFEIQAVPTGNFQVRISLIGYLTDTLPAISFSKGKIETLNHSLRPIVTDAVTITAVRETGSEASVVAEVKEAEQVVSAVSSQQIAKNQDRNTAEVLRRLPGVTLMENRFVMIRGLNERYNSVMLNDALTPSAEVDKKAFSFDVIPSGVLDRVLIYKTGAPELPGEFSGGVIKVFTKALPDSNGISIGLSTALRPGTTFHEFFAPAKGKYDFLGIDDGTRALPVAFPANLYSVGGGESLTTFGRMLSNNWTVSSTKALPDARFNLVLNKVFDLRKIRIGNITTLSYAQTRERFSAENYNYNAYDPAAQRSDTIYRYQDATYNQNVRLGLMHNWAIYLNPNHTLQFRNLFNQTGLGQTILRTGANFEEGFDVKNYAMRWQQRTMYNGQLQGTHDFRNDLTQIKWTLGASLVQSQEPDFRRIRTVRDLSLAGTDAPYQVIIAPAASNLDAGRFYSTLHEKVLMGSVDFEHTLRLRQDKFQPKIRFGVYAERKDRSFQARWMSYKKASSSHFDNSLLHLPLDSLFASENINSYDGFKLEEGTNPSDAYTAANTLVATYLGLSLPFSKKVNLNTGVRVEYNRQELYSRTFSNQIIAVNNPIFSPLPSANLTYSFNEKQLIRLAYSHTVNRPEFRELAPFAYYDFSFNNVLYGNDSLSIANVHNYDLRWELYPSATEMVSLGVFYKDFVHPIETFFVPGSGSGGTRNFTFRNAERSQSLGAEVEIRKTLANLVSGAALDNFGVMLNASAIYSRVDLGAQAVGQSTKRPMMGQSPFIVNAGLYYSHPDARFQANVLYNVVGRRLFAVGTFGTPDIYEMPRNGLDINLTKSLGKNFEVRFSWQDVLNAPTRLMQDSNADGTIGDGDETIVRYRKGSYLTFGLNAKF